MNNEPINRYTTEIIEEISQSFRDPRNPNNVDLVKLREFINKDKNLNDNHIFKRKLNGLNKYDTINRQDF